MTNWCLVYIAFPCFSFKAIFCSPKVPPAETVSHEALERYVEKIVGPKKSGQEDYSNGYLLLDYHWQEQMGDLKFKKNHFPNANETVKMVKWVNQLII